MNQRSAALWVPASLLCFLLLQCQPVFAAPGGEIASVLFKTPVGRVVGAILFVILSPWIIYTIIKESQAEKQTLIDLRVLAGRHREFDWLTLKERVTGAFHQVHSAWRKEDMEAASQCMTMWYWQNQQLAFLDQWERDGLVNHCRVRSIKRIRPLFVRFHNADGNLDGSRLVVNITADMEDYLAERATGKIVQGAKGYAQNSSVWTFLFEGGKWVVANIEPDAVALAYAKLVNEMPGLTGGPASAALAAAERARR